MKRFKKHILLLGALFLLALNCNSQINCDSLFNVAIDHARVKEYSEAIDKASIVVVADSSRNDVRLFIANVYAWQSEYSESKRIIQEVYTASPANEDLYTTWLNVLLWNKEYVQLLKTVKIAVDNQYGNQHNLTMKEALAYKGLKQYSGGIRAINQQSNLLDSADVIDLYKSLMNLDKSNVISLYYKLEVFDQESIDPQHLGYVEYGLNNKREIWILRLNYANRFDLQDFQPEVDWYHNFDNGNYFYANYGFGFGNSLFANHKIGFEYYLPFGKGNEASLGVRYLVFPDEDAVVTTGSISKYIANWWISARPYVAIKDGGYNFTGLLKARLYDNNPINYWGMELSYGNSPDDLYFYSIGKNNEWHDAYRLRLERNMSLGKVNELRVSAGYGHEEIKTGLFRDRFIFDILFKRRF
ncbi:YaiO family outer membrane beta-barrel protein [Carboxylicivirga sp. M1479]|uniref:YaiO family outer membrane beta-barrel protein n=1 Tax=Carboxylicivirga sp. M1479 TaxID=2594476 RepID=UPI0011773915|nr:YaiO family outer membrane beta-barrel protein [Carboxylicivirga sp. M1479]TRX62375.1 YaiO family outer membrane beta-barrel protein [Carboxylicivirga sp. M1479]